MEEDVIHMSLSDLVKKTAMQICYLRKNQDKVQDPTPEQIEGHEIQLAKAQTKLVEMHSLLN
jgi:hypothetical protein